MIIFLAFSYGELCVFQRNYQIVQPLGGAKENQDLHDRDLEISSIPLQPCLGKLQSGPACFPAVKLLTVMPQLPKCLS